MNENGITIIRCANGWNVLLPFENRGYPVIGGGIDYSAFVAAGKEIHGSLDPVMEKIEKEKRQELAEEKQIECSRQPNLYTFKTFAEVLSFLKYKIIE